MAYCHSFGAMNASAIIQALGGDKTVADATGSARSTVAYWRHRDSIPAEHWECLVMLAGARSFEIGAALMRHAAGRKSRRTAGLSECRA